MLLNTLLGLSSMLAIHLKTGNMSNGLMNARLNVVKAHDLHIPSAALVAKQSNMMFMLYAMEKA